MAIRKIYTPADQAADAQKASQFVQSLNMRTLAERLKLDATLAANGGLPSEAERTAMREAERIEAQEVAGATEESAARAAVEDAARGAVVDASA